MSVAGRSTSVYVNWVRVFTRPWVTRWGDRLLDLSASCLGSHISPHVPVQVRLLHGPNAGTKQTHTTRRSRWMQMQDGKVQRCLRKKRESLNEEIDSLHFSFSILGRLDFVPIFFKAPSLLISSLSSPLQRNIGEIFFFPLSGFFAHSIQGWAHVLLLRCCYAYVAVSPRDDVHAPLMPLRHNAACIWMHVRAHVRFASAHRRLHLSPASGPNNPLSV